MIHDFQISFEQELTAEHIITNHHLLEVKLEAGLRKSSNLSTCGSFSQPSSDHPCDLTSSPALSNEDNAEVEHLYQILTESDQQIADVTWKVSNILQEIVKFQITLDKKNTRNRKNVCFNNTCIPSIVLHEYLKKIMSEAKLEIDICITALFYVDRLIGMQPNFSINEYNCHRLILTSLMIASKMHQDIQSYQYPVKLFSLIGGVCESDLFQMEKELLSLLNFKLFIDEVDYIKYKDQLNSFTV